MSVYSTVVLAALLSPVLGMMVSFTKPDGSLDVSGLANHIALIEQELKSKAAASDVEHIESAMVPRDEVNNLHKQVASVMKDLNSTNDQLAATKNELRRSQTELKVVQSKLTIALGELEDIAKVKADLAVLQSQMRSMNTTNNQHTRTLSVIRGEVETFQSQLSKLQNETEISNRSLRGEMTTLKAEIDQLQNDTKVTSLQGQMATLESEVVQLDLSSETISNLSTTIQQLQLMCNNSVQHGESTYGISVYTRWGRTSCPPENNMVYKGYAAGSYYQNNGGSASILCLPEHPIDSNHSFGIHEGFTSQIWGTQYVSVYKDMPFESLSQKGMPCVVCESNRSTSIMVPARNACYQGWTREYSGFLMGGVAHHSSADYICVDTDAEAIAGGHGRETGRWMYPVEFKCGVLACPPYVNGKFATCAVCSK